MCAKKKKMLYDIDKWLKPYKDAIDKRQKMILDAKEKLSKDGSLSKGLNNHMYYGLHHDDQGNWVFREWAPNATKIYLIGDFNNWKRSEAYALRPLGGGNWEIKLPAMFLDHGTLYKLFIEWPGGGAERLPAYVTRTVQDVQTKQFCAQVWDPVKPYEWRNPKPGKRPHPLIYVDNEAEGLGLFDGKETLYFYDGWQGHHPAWGSRCFDYGKDETKYFLLSNCKYWMEEYNMDGFRFDGVTSMLYWDHGLEKDFVGYENYFNQGVDPNAITYLALANILIHEIDKNAFTIAEDVSGMAGLAAPIEMGGVGFDFRMSMGVADNWIKWIKEIPDDYWSMGEMWWQLTNKRDDEKTISYAECHDQAMVGDKTIAFRLMDKEMYFSMNKESQSPIVDRGLALHKMIRLVTMATCGNGYLTFMGNEFGHPEWIDFPREGNNWSFKHARRQWSLAEPDYLRYRYLRNFDKAMIHLAQQEGILDEKPELFVQDEEKKILIFKRKSCIFALNFNPTASFADYGFAAPAGKYEGVMNTDENEFDGFSRLKTGEEHFSVPVKSENGNGKYEHSLSLYLPSRCAVVLKKID